MNPFKGAGAILLALAVVAALTQVKDVAHLILLASVTIVGLCMVTLIVSGLRRHHDRLAALGRIAAAPEAAAPARPQPQPVPVPVPAPVAASEPAQDDDTALWRPYAS